jgi:hypothetical protein
MAYFVYIPYQMRLGEVGHYFENSLAGLLLLVIYFVSTQQLYSATEHFSGAVNTCIVTIGNDLLISFRRYPRILTRYGTQSHFLENVI